MVKTNMKLDLNVDVDNTIYPTNEVMPIMYEEMTGLKPKTYFTKEWNMKDCYDKVNKIIIHKMFDEDDFYYLLNIYDGCKQVLYELSSIYNIKFVSVGTPRNLENKYKWLQEQFPFIPTSNYMLLNQVGKVNGIDKSCCKDVIIDDNLTALETSNCDLKLLYQPYGHTDLQWQNGYLDLFKQGKIDYISTEWDQELLDVLISYSINKSKNY